LTQFDESTNSSVTDSLVTFVGQVMTPNQSDKFIIT
jgi:hypothetical protein